MIAGIALAVMQGSLAQTVHTQKQLEGRVTAAILGQNKLTELIYESEPSTSGDFPAPYSRFKWHSTEEATDDGSTLIVLTLEWGDGRDLHHQKVFIGHRDPQ